jgi:hypothetical protein
MRKNASSVIVFTVILCCLIYLLQFGIDLSYRSRVKNKFTHLLNHQVDAEIMVFGSSIAHHQIDPEIITKVTSMPAYNMGWDGLFFVQYNALLKEYISYQKKARCIVIACDFENLGKNELITRPDLFLAYLNNEHIYNSLREIEPGKMAKALYVPGYKFTLLNKAFYNALLFPATEKGRGGYEPVANNNWQVVSDTLKPFKARYNERIYTELKSTIAAITQKGIKVVVVMTPVYEQGYKMITNAEEIKAKYRSLAGNGVYFLDYTQDTLSRSREHFINYSHLNPDGAATFTHTLAKDLQGIMGQNK